MMDDIDHFHHLQKPEFGGSKRRDFLRNSGSLGTLAALSVLPIAIPASATTTTTINANGLFRWENKCSTEFATLLGQAGVNGYALEHDLVRQWRDGLGDVLIKYENKSIVGLTNWSDYFMIRELASESRKFPLVEVQLSSNQYQNKEVLQHYAEQLLAVVNDPNNKTLQQRANQFSSRNTQSRSLFAWVIV